jgi:uncharacterized protein (DUF488 family)
VSAHTIYTLGYLNATPEAVDRYVEELGALLVDTRFTPTSRNPVWRQGPLRRLLGDRYVHIKALGNERYRQGPPIKLHQPEEGMAQLRPLVEAQPVILLCACRDVNLCHRKLIAEMAADAWGVEVVHLPQDRSS